VPDGGDGCPTDPGKTEPGVCGCGVADTDSDNDGTPDCDDLCPVDPGKTEPGVCGCGTPDTDTDTDDTPDCIDAFPNDPTEWADSDGDGVGDNSDAFPQSNMDATVCIGDCDSGVANQVLADGATFNDLIGEAAAEAKNHGKFVSAVSKLANQWKKDGLISGKEKGKITSCAARSDIP